MVTMRSKRLILADLRELLHPIYTDLAADSLLLSCEHQGFCEYFVKTLRSHRSLPNRGITCIAMLNQLCSAVSNPKLQGCKFPYVATT